MSKKSKKNLIFGLLIGVFLGTFIIPLILEAVNFPSINTILINIFGENSPLVAILVALILILVVFVGYKCYKS